MLRAQCARSNKNISPREPDPLSMYPQSRDSTEKQSLSLFEWGLAMASAKTISVAHTLLPHVSCVCFPFPIFDILVLSFLLVLQTRNEPFKLSSTSACVLDDLSHKWFVWTATKRHVAELLRPVLCSLPRCFAWRLGQNDIGVRKLLAYNMQSLSSLSLCACVCVLPSCVFGNQYLYPLFQSCCPLCCGMHLLFRISFTVHWCCLPEFKAVDWVRCPPMHCMPNSSFVRLLFCPRSRVQQVSGCACDVHTQVGPRQRLLFADSARQWQNPKASGIGTKQPETCRKAS